MKNASRSYLVGLFIGLAACLPDFDGESSPAKIATAWSFRPTDELGRPLPVFRASHRGLGAGSALLVRGDLSDSQLAAWARGDAPDSLLAREMSLGIYQEGGAYWVAPEQILLAGERYSLGLAASGTIEAWRVSDLPTRIAGRLFPSIDEPSSFGLSVYCAETELPVGLTALRLQPGDWWADVSVGTPRGDHKNCMLLQPRLPLPAGRYVPPLGTDHALLDPAAIVIGAPADNQKLICETTEEVLGRACVRVFDDRVLIRVPVGPGLWSLSWPNGSALRVAGEISEFWVKGLIPNTQQRLVLESLTLTDNIMQQSAVEIRTLPAQAHLVINEVYADAVGPEPASEWVEIFNDGLAPAELGGLRFEDIGGSVELPSLTLAVGGYALLVNEGFLADPDYDVEPDPAALMVVLFELGKNGLKNDGEVVRLVDSAGTLSLFPATPKPKPGQSISRRTPTGHDGDPSAFERTTAPTPGRANSVSSR